jgi:serine/threonine protein kinase
MDYSIFVSYRRKDTSITVSLLLQRLQQRFGRNEVFVDREDSKLGEAWKEKVQDALRNSSLVLVVIGGKWLTAQGLGSGQLPDEPEEDWVITEVEMAQSLNKPIISILCDIDKLPYGVDLPEPISRLAGLEFQSIRFQAGDETVVEKLIDEVADVLQNIKSPDEVRSGLERILADKYKVIRRISKGRKYDVYLGQDVRLHRNVVFKVVNEPGNNDDFVHGLQLAAEISDKVPNSVPILGAYIDEAPYHVVTAYLKEGSLRKFLDAFKPLPFEQAKKILLDVALSLKESHKINQAHGQVKPSNILLGLDQVPFLNFISKAALPAGKEILQRISGLNEEEYVEELYCLPPEALKNPVDSPEVVKKMDQYMLGIIGWEMLTGSSPKTYSIGKGDKVTFKPFFEDIDRKPNYPSKIWEVLSKMTAEDPDDRYKSMEEVIDAMHAVSSDCFEIAKESFDRCLSTGDGGSSFFQKFYKKLSVRLPDAEAEILRSKKIGDKAEHRQYELLRQGIFMLLQFGQRQLGEKEPNILSSVAKIHGRLGFNISPDSYRLFKEEFLKVVGKRDPQCLHSKAEKKFILDNWKKALKPGIKYMKGKSV